MNDFNERIANLSAEKRALLEAHLKGGEGIAERAIPRRPEFAPAPLSFAQQRMWFMDQLQPGNPAYNRPTHIHLRGALNIAVLENSVNEIVRRHEILRTSFLATDGQPVQAVASSLTLSLPVIDLGSLPAYEQQAEVSRMVTEDAQHPFDLSRVPLLKVKLVHLGETEHLLVLTLHHIVFDGWSAGILIRELSTLYKALSAGEQPTLPELPIQFADFARWQRQRMQGGVLDAELAYWKTKLSGQLPLLELSTDRARPPAQTFRGARQHLSLPANVSASLKSLSQREGATLFMTLLAAFQALLHRYTGGEDIIVGVPIAGRNRLEVENLIGVFINTLALRTDLSGNPSFRQLLGRVRTTALEAYAHQELPFEKLVEELQPVRDLSRTPVFQVLFQLRNLPDESVEANEDLRMAAADFDSGSAKLDIALDIVNKPEGLSCVIEYNTDLFDATTICRMAAHFEMLLRGIVADPAQRIADLPLLSDAEGGQLLRHGEATRAANAGQAPIDQGPGRRGSCFIIGIGTLLIQCAQMLLRHGLEVRAVISADSIVEEWADKTGVTCVSPASDWRPLLGNAPFDYLFSIVNMQVLPREILALPRHAAINYHDGPLPRYAGTYVTSWAIMQGEATYGVTWHLMSEGVDTGDILEQRTFTLDAAETAFTLNLKCYEAAAAAFADLLDGLARGELETKKQNLAERSFFPRFKRLSTVVSWLDPAQKIDALVRALDFGRYANPLGLPKLLVESDYLIIRRLDIQSTSQKAAPGTITAIASNSITIATGSGEVALRDLATLEGKPLPIAEFAARYRLRVGYRFDAQRRAAHIAEFQASISRHESFWVERLATLRPLTLSHLAASRSSGAARYATRLMVFPDGAIGQRESRRDFVLACLAAYFARTTDAIYFDLGFRDRESQCEAEGFEALFAACVPLRIEIDAGRNFAEALQAICAERQSVTVHKTYASDVLVRYPVLRDSIAASNAALPVIVNYAEALERPQPAGILHFVIAPEAWLCAYDEARLAVNAIESMLTQIDALMKAIIAAPERTIAELVFISDTERRWLSKRTADPAGSVPCIHHLFEAQAASTPDAIAVVSDHAQLSYRELNRRANRLAHHLQSLGVGPEVLVGVCLERSIEMIVALFAVLKAGGAYVPMDPAYPKQRLAYVSEDAKLAVLLTQGRHATSLSECGTRIVCVDTESESTRLRDDNTESEVAASNLAYVIYTSGSTGKPKGVMIEHRSLASLHGDRCPRICDRARRQSLAVRGYQLRCER